MVLGTVPHPIVGNPEDGGLGPGISKFLLKLTHIFEDPECEVKM